jgi:hypothetical protein
LDISLKSDLTTLGWIFFSGRNKRKQTEIEPGCFKWTPPPHIHLTESLLSLKNKEKSGDRRGGVYGTSIHRQTMKFLIQNI